MDELGDGRRSRPEGPGPLTVLATRSGGARLRAAAVIAAGLVVVGAGVYGRLDAARPPAPVTTLVPATVVASPAPPGADSIETHGYVPPLPEFLPHTPARTTEPGGNGLTGGRTSEAHLLAVIMLEGQPILFSRLDRDAKGIYQAMIPLLVPRQAATATLELYAQTSGRTDGDVDPLADRAIASLPIQVDARPFPPGSLSALAERNAGRPNSLPAGSVTVPGFTVLATLFSNGHAVELSIVVAPRRPQSGARRKDPCRQAMSPYLRSAPDRTIRC